MDIERQFIGLKESDDKVLQYIYVSNYPKVEQYIVDNSGTADDARDIYQDAFLAAWRNVQLDKFRPQNDTAIAGYIFQIARNKWLDQLRSVKNKKTTSLPDDREGCIAEPGAYSEHSVPRATIYKWNFAQTLHDRVIVQQHHWSLSTDFGKAFRK